MLLNSLRQLLRLSGLLLIGALSLQIYFLARVALMGQIDPSSTTFQRSQAVSIVQQGQLAWSQRWAPLSEIGTALPRAVIASEDAGFMDHAGLEWDAIEKARERNERREQRRTAGPVRLMGGSTITQQLAKNLFLSGERTYWRKGQEALIALAMEAVLDKSRILEIYLNSVEWGQGVFGARAAAQHYFRVEPRQLQPLQAARLAVMLPAPRRFERLPQSPYLASRAETIAARMGAVAVPEGLAR